MLISPKKLLVPESFLRTFYFPVNGKNPTLGKVFLSVNKLYLQVLCGGETTAGTDGKEGVPVPVAQLAKRSSSSSKDEHRSFNSWCRKTHGMDAVGESER